MKLRRCSTLMLEPREAVSFDLEDLLSGGSGAQRRFAWIALVPWRAEEAELSAEEVAALAALSESQWRERAELDAVAGAAALDGLIAKGVAVSDDEAGSVARERDQAVRDQHWLPVAAASHYFTRWTGVDNDPEQTPPGYDSMRGLISKLGAPPLAIASRADAAQRIVLPGADATAFDALLARRVTCRNFDTARSLTLAQLGQTLARVFAAQSIFGFENGEEVVKKNHPSGGALHPLEAYVLVQRVEGLAPGLYHYHAATRALEPLPGVEDPDTFARRCTGGQRYFAQAPVLVVMTARFERSFWKYRRHAKAYRAVLLEAGHASQNLYLAATELGLGAFITAAINEVEIEQAFGLDPLREGPIAVCGFGPRGAERVTTEFDPLHQVWP